MEEIDEIEEVLKSLEGKDAKQKVFIIESQLGVKIADLESSYSLSIIRAIIEARIIEPCPICKAEIKPGEHCSACDGKGYVSAVEAEKILLKLKQGG